MTSSSNDLRGRVADAIQASYDADYTPPEDGGHAFAAEADAAIALVAAWLRSSEAGRIAAGAHGDPWYIASHLADSLDGSLRQSSDPEAEDRAAAYGDGPDA